MHKFQLILKEKVGNVKQTLDDCIPRIESYIAYNCRNGKNLIEHWKRIIVQQYLTK